MKKAVLVALLCVGHLSVAAGSDAAPIFVDRALFNAANPGASAITLDGRLGTVNYPDNYPAGTGYDTADPGGITVDGVNVLGTSFGVSETYLLANDVAGGVFTLDGTDALVGGRETTRFLLPTNVGAFGMNYGLSSGGLGSLTMTVYFRDASTESYLLNVTQRSQFVGIVGADIDSILFDTGLRDELSPYLLSDELTYAGGELVPTPEPASLVMFGTGLLGCAAFARRRRREEAQGRPTGSVKCRPIPGYYGTPMSLHKVSARVFVSMLAAGAIPAAVQAAPIFSTPTLNNVLTINFSLPVQPADYGAIQFNLGGPISSLGAPTTTSELYEGSTLLGTTWFGLPFLGRFTDPTNFFASPATNINFAPVADGITNGIAVLRLGGSGNVTWNTDEVYGMTFGDSGIGSPAWYPQVTAVNVSTESVSPVPEPATLSLFAVGMSGLAVARRRRRSRS